MSLQEHLCHIDTFRTVKYSVQFYSFQRSVEDVVDSFWRLVGCKAFGSIQSCVKLSSFTVGFMLGLILVLWRFTGGLLITRLTSLPSSTKNVVKVVVRGDRDSRANLMPIYGDLYQILL